MPWPEVLARVRRYMGLGEGAFGDPAIPTLHRQAATARERPLNLVIILEESLGAAHVGRLGGLALTPNLDRLAGQGLWFTRLYATGTRTSRGMEAVAAGFPPTPAPAVLKLPRAQHGFVTLGTLLRRRGYSTEFLYGGVANFDNMRAFYLNNGFDRVIEQKDFADPVFLGSWGVSDEDLMRKAHDTFVAHGDAPFFALLLSTTNHEPFEFPDGRIEPYEQPLATRYNAMKYADYALGQFFERARGAAYFRNTVFVVVADHEARVFGTERVPVRHFRIPAVIIGPGVAPGVFERPASQIDLAPTLLALLGIEAAHPMIGRDLLALAPGVEGRALMQFESQHAFRVGNRLVVHAPHQPPRTYAIDARDRLTPAAENPELTRDALAHALWASQTYERQLYRLPDDGRTGFNAQH
jgi:phosphoglycerol transferase MdoB-like AlkP superfamily enzyme